MRHEVETLDESSQIRHRSLKFESSSSQILTFRFEIWFKLKFFSVSKIWAWFKLKLKSKFSTCKSSQVDSFEFEVWLDDQSRNRNNLFEFKFLKSNQSHDFQLSYYVFALFTVKTYVAWRAESCQKHFQRLSLDFIERRDDNNVKCYSTLSIKKCSLKSLNANDRSRRISINFVFVFLKVDKFNQYLIHVLNAIDHQILFAQSSKLILSARVRTVVSQLAHQSAIIYDYHLSSQNSRIEWAHFNAVKITEIDSLSQ